MRLAFLGLALVALSMTNGARRTAVVVAATAQVDATNAGSTNLFSPATIAISVGDTVQWNFIGDNPHTVTSTGSESFDSGLPPTFPGGSAYSHTFTTAGSFAYRCIVHSEMTGAVNVSAPTATATSVSATDTPVPTNTPGSTSTPGTPTETSTPGTPTTTPTTQPTGSVTAATPTPGAVEAVGVTVTPQPVGSAVAAQQLPRTGDRSSRVGDSPPLLALGGAGITLLAIGAARRRRMR